MHGYHGGQPVERIGEHVRAQIEHIKEEPVSENFGGYTFSHNVPRFHDNKVVTVAGRERERDRYHDRYDNRGMDRGYNGIPRGTGELGGVGDWDRRDSPRDPWRRDNGMGPRMGDGG